MPVKLLKKTHSEEFEKIFFPIQDLWGFFLNSHEQEYSSENFKKPSLALYKLVESLFRFSTNVLVADYLAHPARHNKVSHKLVQEYLTHKRSFLQYWLPCLENLWNNSSCAYSFIPELASTNVGKIYRAFESILQPSLSTSKRNKRKINKKEYMDFVRALGKLSPLVEIWNEYTIIRFQDYPWQEGQENIVPVLSYQGKSESAFSLQPIYANSYGVMGQVYLWSSKRNQCLSLFPFILPGEEENNLEFFRHFSPYSNKKSEYISYPKNEKAQLSGTLKRVVEKEHKTIYSFLQIRPSKHSFSNQTPSTLKVFTFEKNLLEIPLDSLGEYQKILNSFHHLTKSPKNDFSLNLNRSLGKLFIQAFIHKICELGFLKVMPKIGFSKQLLNFSTVVQDKLSLETAQEIIQSFIEEESFLEAEQFLEKLWKQKLLDGEIHWQITLLEWWARYDWKQASKKFLEVKDINKDEAFRAVLKPLLNQEQGKDAVKIYRVLHPHIVNSSWLNREIGAAAINTLLRENPKLCFEICHEFLNPWDIEWLDEVLDKLMEVSIPQTISLLFKRDMTPSNFDAVRWDRLFKIYTILQKNKPQEILAFLEAIEDPVSRTRLEALHAISEQRWEDFQKILTQVPFFSSLENILSTLYFLANTLKNLSFPLHNKIFQEVIQMVNAYSEHLLGFLSGYRIKKRCEKLFQEIDPAKLVRLQKSVGAQAQKNIFHFFISFLIAEKKIDAEEIGEFTLLLQDGFFTNSPTTSKYPLPEHLQFSQNKSLLKENNDPNTINQLLAEVAAVMWSINQRDSLYYLSQIIPDTLFDREDAIKKIIATNLDITLFDLELFTSQGYELERLNHFWVGQTIQKSPSMVLDLYEMVNENLRTQIVTEGLPLLVKTNFTQAVNLVRKFSKGTAYDFGHLTGKIFLDILHYDYEVGEKFLDSLDIWELTRQSEMGKSLLKVFKKLSTKKLTNLYEEFVLSSQSHSREQMACLILSAMVTRRPASTFRRLSKLSHTFPEETIEEMLLALIEEIIPREPELAKILYLSFYNYIQEKSFSIDEESFIKLSESIDKGLKEDKSWIHAPEVYVHRWTVFPSLLAKVCRHLILFSYSERGVFLSRYLTGKTELFAILGDPPMEVIAEKSGIWEMLLLPPNEKLSLSKKSQEALFKIIEQTTSRLKISDMDKISPYLCHSFFSNQQRFTLATLFESKKKRLSITSNFALLVAKECQEFQRTRFEESVKIILEKMEVDELDNFDLEKQIHIHAFQSLIRLRKDCISEIYASYWDQMNFIASIFAQVFHDNEQQWEWVQKIIGTEERLETLEDIAGIHLIEESKISVIFLDEIVRVIEYLGGFELIYTRIPNITVLLLRDAPQMCISLIENIEDEQVFSYAIESVLEFLADPDNFSKSLYLALKEWVQSPRIHNSLAPHDILYFYSQIAIQLLEENATPEAKELIESALHLSQKCDVREIKYYLEDLIEPLLDKDLQLALKITLPYQKNDEYFKQIILKWARQDVNEAIERVENNASLEITCQVLSEIACEFAFEKPDISLKILNRKEMSGYQSPIFSALATAEVKKRKEPSAYLKQITDPNQKFLSYCEVAAIYKKNGDKKSFAKYRKKVQQLISGITSNSHLFGMMLEWPGGYLLEIDSYCLEHLGIVEPKLAMKMFDIYFKNDRFMDTSEAAQHLFRGLSQYYPEMVMDLLEQESNLDIEEHKAILIEEAKTNPIRVLKWILACQRHDLYPIVLDRIKNEETLLECLTLILSPNFSDSREIYLEKIACIVPYLFQIGKCWLLLDVLRKLQNLCVESSSTLSSLLEKFEHISRDWEKETLSTIER